MADGHHFDTCLMQYLNNHLTDFDEICMATKNLKIEKFENPRLWTTAMLKIEKKRDILYVQY